MKETNCKPVTLALDALTLDPRLQSRELKTSVVEDYRKALQRGEVLPPICVVRDRSDHYYLVDGYHRVAANQKRNGIDTITAEIIDGTFDDALWHSWAANRSHGLRRTREENRRIIRAALRHRKWRKTSDRAIARQVGCDHKTVAAIRRYMERAGEFPTRDEKKIRSKAAVLRACKRLAEVQTEVSFDFDRKELAVVRGAKEILNRLVIEARRAAKQAG